MKLNLHTHTRWSDGYLSFMELIQRAEGLGLEYLAMSDHDRTKAWSKRNVGEVKQYITIESLEHGLLQSEKLKIVQGIELSANDEGKEVHILGLYLDQPDEEFEVYLDAIERYRWLRAGSIAKELDMDLDLLMKEVGTGLPSRLHFGYIKFLEEQQKDENERDPEITCARDTMKKYVGPKTKAYVSFNVDFIYTPQRAIERILKSGGIPVWAHPERIDLPLEETFERYKGYANGKPFGVEVTDPKNLEAMMNKYGLVSIGNDFHGYPYEPKEKSLIVEVPNELANELIKRLDTAKKEIKKPL